MVVRGGRVQLGQCPCALPVCYTQSGFVLQRQTNRRDVLPLVFFLRFLSLHLASAVVVAQIIRVSEFLFKLADSARHDASTRRPSTGKYSFPFINFDFKFNFDRLLRVVPSHYGQ